MHLELNHDSGGIWSDPKALAISEPQIKVAFPAKNRGEPRPYTGGGSYHLMNGLDASQGTYASADGSVVQASDVDLGSAIPAHLENAGGVLTGKNAGVLCPNTTR